MASMDSDSSGEDNQSFRTTDVLLGYASKDPTDDPFSQLGGRPTWPDTENPPSALFAKCKVCNRMMTLLLQLNGDLPERFPGHERRLYILACRSKTCKKKSGSIRAVRGTKVSQDTSSGQQEKVQPPLPAPSQPRRQLLGDSIFGTKSPSTASANSNPFSTSSDRNTNSNPFATSCTSVSNPLSDLSSKPAQRPDDLPMTFAQKVEISSPPPSSAVPPTKVTPHQSWPSQAELPPPYPSYHLDADYETLDDRPSPQPSSSHSISVDQDDGGSAGGGGKDEAYESTLDATFQRFATRLAHNPLQVLRYEFDGCPQLYSKSDAVGKLFLHAKPKIPRCDNCGRARLFELQLVPQAIAELEIDETGLEGMEWGTILLGVCSADCGDGKEEWAWREEWVGVQWEEASGRR